MRFPVLNFLVSRYRRSKLTQLNNSFSLLPSTENYTSEQLVVHLSRILLRTSVDSSYILPSSDIETCLRQNSVRYRSIHLARNFVDFDFGILLLSPSNSTGYIIIERYLGQILATHISSSVSFDSIPLHEFDLVNIPSGNIYELYPALPYSLPSIYSFISFVFSSFRSDIYSLIFYSSLAQIVGLSIPLLTVYVTTTVVDSGSVSFAIVIGLLVFLLAIFSTLALYLQNRVIQKLESETDKRAQVSVWDRLFKLDLVSLKNYSDGDLLSRASSISQIRTLLSSSNITSIISLVFATGYLIEMYIYLPSSALYVLPLVLAYLFVVAVKAKTGSKLLHASLSNRALYTDNCISIIDSLAESRSRNSTQLLVSRWKKLVSSISLLTKSYHEKDNSLEILSRSFTSIAFLVSFSSLILNGYFNLEDKSFLASLIGYTAALNLFCASLSSGTVTVINSVISVLAHWKRASPVIFSPIEIGYSSICRQLLLTGEVKVTNLAFSYPNTRNFVFQDLDLTILSSSFNSLVLPCGCGSTTLSKLLLGLYPLTEGSILYDCHPIESIQIATLRSQVSLASQKLYIPFGSLFNLFHGPLATTDEDLTTFLDVFGLLPLVEHSRMGIDTPVIGGGSQFSFVQRQLFSLAHAVSTHPSLLIIDNSVTEIPISILSNIFSFLLSKQITILYLSNKHPVFSNPTFSIHYLDSSLPS